MEALLKEETRNRIAILAYVVYVAELILFDSMFGTIESLQRMFALVRVTCYILVCGKLLLDMLARAFAWKEVLCVGCITLLLVVVMFTTGNKAMLIYWTFIVAMRNVDFNKIIKMSFWVHVICLVVVIGSSYAGILENRIYSEEIRNRQSLGFQYTTDSINLFFYTILMWIYWRKEKVTWIELGTMALTDVYLFKCTDTKSAFLLGLGAVIIATALKLSTWLRHYKKLYSVVAVGIVPFLSAWIIDLSIRYDKEVPWMKSLNKIVSARLQLGHEAYLTYGIRPLGQRIEWIGGTIKFEEVKQTYNYVDSSYMQILLNFGPIILGLLLAAFVVLGVKIAKKADTYFVVVLAILAVHSTFDPQIIWMEYNTFLMMYSYLELGKKQALEAT